MAWQIERVSLGKKWEKHYILSPLMVSFFSAFECGALCSHIAQNPAD